MYIWSLPSFHRTANPMAPARRSAEGTAVHCKSSRDFLVCRFASNGSERLSLGAVGRFGSNRPFAGTLGQRWFEGL